MRLTVTLTIAFLCLLAVPAVAQPGLSAPGQTTRDASPPPPYVHEYKPETTLTKYGWQVVAADVASWALIVAGSDGDAEGLATVGVAGMFLGGPIVHLAQGNGKGAGYSLLARVGLPIGGFLLGRATCDNRDDWDCLGPMLLGTTIGYGSALFIDYFHLARKTEVTGPPSGWASLRPSLQVAPGGAKAGVAFNF